jgi:hypothetical protein
MKNTLGTILMAMSLLLMPALSLAQTDSHQGHAQQGGPAQAAPSQAENAPQAQHEPGAMGGMHHGMMAKCMEEKKARKEKVASELKALDDKLNEKLTAMSAAKGEKKVEAMAAVLSELVAQRKEIHEKLVSLQDCPMMRHGGMGGMHGMKSGCPMMKNMPHGTPDTKTQQ